MYVRSTETARRGITTAPVLPENEHTAMIAHLLVDGLAGAAILANSYSMRGYLPGAGRLAKVMFAAGFAVGSAATS
jgi:hypothetical protein